MGVVGGCVYDKETLQVLDNVGMMHTSMVRCDIYLLFIRLY